MNKNFFAGLLAGLGLLAIVAFRPVRQVPSVGVQKWEYKRIIGGPRKTVDEDMKAAGEQGWELVTDHATGDLIFKRPME